MKDQKKRKKCESANKRLDLKNNMQMIMKNKNRKKNWRKNMLRS